MTILLILGLFLLGASVVFVVRAFSLPRNSGTVPQIGRYGFHQVQRAQDEPEERALDRLATAIGDYLGKRLSWFREEELRVRLVSAGLYSTTPTRFLGYQALLALVLLCLWVWLGGVSDYSPVALIVGAIIAVVIGWLLPAGIVALMTRKRREQIEYELPEMIDLLVVSVEAGVSLSGALRLAAREVHGPLGEELRLTLQEQNMGLGTTEALENLGVRADTPNMRIFVRSIVQGETLGISIGQIMRNLALEMRKRRKAAAEERAQKAPVKMVFPLVFLIFPAMFIVLLLPALMNIADAFS